MMLLILMRLRRLISMKIRVESDSYEEESKSTWVGIYVTLVLQIG
jgi:hypothetical protein